MTRTAGWPPRRPPGTFVPAAFYPIIDVPSGTAPDWRIADAVLAAGVPWLQLRAKGLPAADHLGAARELVRRAAASGARVIVNDRLDVALAAGAAGVHVGQDDLPLEDVRRVAAGRLVVGVSTHDVDQARAAAAGAADYVGFGPMYATATKAGALPARSLAELRAVRAAIDLPIVAIGGITEATAAKVLAAGADAVAMIGALAAAPDPGALAARLLRPGGVG